jgi:hypothetical protein
MTASEIEDAIRKLPAGEARKLLDRLKDLDKPNSSSTTKPITDELVEKWRVKSGFPAGLTTDQYLQIVRNGHCGR